MSITVTLVVLVESQGDLAMFITAAHTATEIVTVQIDGLGGLTA